MTKQNKKAIKDSIAHWKRMRAFKVGEAKEKARKEHTGSHHCPLCKLYFALPNDYDCKGCPVRKRTGYRDCKKTPYLRASTMFLNYIVEPNRQTKKAWQQVAAEEIAFLESLLEDER